MFLFAYHIGQFVHEFTHKQIYEKIRKSLVHRKQKKIFR